MQPPLFQLRLDKEIDRVLGQLRSVHVRNWRICNRSKRPKRQFFFGELLAAGGIVRLGTGGPGPLFEPGLDQRDLSRGDLFVAGGHLSREHSLEEGAFDWLIAHQRRARIAPLFHPPHLTQIESPLDLTGFTMAMPAVCFQDRPNLRFEERIFGGIGVDITQGDKGHKGQPQPQRGQSAIHESTRKGISPPRLA